MQLQNHTLFYKASCPYCIFVLDVMRELGIEMELKSTTDSAVRDELISIGGKPQVPCLVIDGKAMYESMDIAAYLRTL